LITRVARRARFAFVAAGATVAALGVAVAAGVGAGLVAVATGATPGSGVDGFDAAAAGGGGAAVGVGGRCAEFEGTSLSSLKCPPSPTSSVASARCLSLR